MPILALPDISEDSLLTTTINHIPKKLRYLLVQTTKRGKGSKYMPSEQAVPSVAVALYHESAFFVAASRRLLAATKNNIAIASWPARGVNHSKDVNYNSNRPSDPVHLHKLRSCSAVTKLRPMTTGQ